MERDLTKFQLDEVLAHTDLKGDLPNLFHPSNITKQITPAITARLPEVNDLLRRAETLLEKIPVQQENLDIRYRQKDSEIDWLIDGVHEAFEGPEETVDDETIRNLLKIGGPPPSQLEFPTFYASSVHCMESLQGIRFLHINLKKLVVYSARYGIRKDSCYVVVKIPSNCVLEQKYDEKFDLVGLLEDSEWTKSSKSRQTSGNNLKQYFVGECLIDWTACFPIKISDAVLQEWVEQRRSSEIAIELYSYLDVPSSRRRSHVNNPPTPVVFARASASLFDLLHVKSLDAVVNCELVADPQTVDAVVGRLSSLPGSRKTDQAARDLRRNPLPFGTNVLGTVTCRLSFSSSPGLLDTSQPTAVVHISPINNLRETTTVVPGPEPLEEALNFRPHQLANESFFEELGRKVSNEPKGEGFNAAQQDTVMRGQSESDSSAALRVSISSKMSDSSSHVARELTVQPSPQIESSRFSVTTRDSDSLPVVEDEEFDDRNIRESIDSNVSLDSLLLDRVESSFESIGKEEIDDDREPRHQPPPPPCESPSRELQRNNLTFMDPSVTNSTTSLKHPIRSTTFPAYGLKASSSNSNSLFNGIFEITIVDTVDWSKYYTPYKEFLGGTELSELGCYFCYQIPPIGVRSDLFERPFPEFPSFVSGKSTSLSGNCPLFSLWMDCQYPAFNGRSRHCVDLTREEKVSDSLENVHLDNALDWVCSCMQNANTLEHRLQEVSDTYLRLALVHSDADGRLPEVDSELFRAFAMGSFDLKRLTTIRSGQVGEFSVQFTCIDSNGRPIGAPFPVRIGVSHHLEPALPPRLVQSFLEAAKFGEIDRSDGQTASQTQDFHKIPENSAAAENIHHMFPNISRYLGARKITGSGEYPYLDLQAMLGLIVDESGTRHHPGLSSFLSQAPDSLSQSHVSIEEVPLSLAPTDHEAIVEVSSEEASVNEPSFEDLSRAIASMQLASEALKREVGAQGIWGGMSDEEALREAEDQANNICEQQSIEGDSRIQRAETAVEDLNQEILPELREDSRSCSSVEDEDDLSGEFLSASKLHDDGDAVSEDKIDMEIVASSNEVGASLEQTLQEELMSRLERTIESPITDADEDQQHSNSPADCSVDQPELVIFEDQTRNGGTAWEMESVEEDPTPSVESRASPIGASHALDQVEQEVSEAVILVEEELKSKNDEEILIPGVEVVAVLVCSAEISAYIETAPVPRRSIRSERDGSSPILTAPSEDVLTDDENEGAVRKMDLVEISDVNNDLNGSISPASLVLEEQLLESDDAPTRQSTDLSEPQPMDISSSRGLNVRTDLSLTAQNCEVDHFPCDKVMESALADVSEGSNDSTTATATSVEAYPRVEVFRKPVILEEMEESGSTMRSDSGRCSSGFRDSLASEQSLESRIEEFEAPDSKVSYVNRSEKRTEDSFRYLPNAIGEKTLPNASAQEIPSSAPSKRPTARQTLRESIDRVKSASQLLPPSLLHKIQEKSREGLNSVSSVRSKQRQFVDAETERVSKIMLSRIRQNV